MDGTRPEYLKQQAEPGLRRLRLDRFDLFQPHRVDPLVPLADRIGALRELRDAGKIRCGTSTTSPAGGTRTCWSTARPPASPSSRDSMAHLEENLGAARVEANEEQYGALDALGSPRVTS